MRILERLWAWVDETTGVSRTLGAVLAHPVPPMPRAGWLYVFGSATLVAFLVQIVTGTALAGSYVTSSGDAYDSLRFITGLPIGRFVRGLHAFGASAMIVLVGIHAIRVYLMAAYKYPRQMNWLTGVGLLFLTLGMAFTGQLLRWDQTGVWTAVIAAEQAGRTPLVGNWIGHFLLSGDVVGGATLSRFFAAHVFFVPALIFTFLGVHLYLVVYNGISEPPASDRPVDPAAYRHWYTQMLGRQGEPFWPDAAWRDVAFGLLVILTIGALAWFVGPPALGRPPDPSTIDASPRPDWYFMWYFALLSLIPRWAEDSVIFFGPLLFGLALILLPLVAPRGHRSLRHRPWALAVVGAIVFIIGHYWSIGLVAPWSPRFGAKPLPASVVQAATPEVARGASLIYAKGSEYCHTVSGYGGIRGPDLTDAGDRMTGDQIKTRIYSGATNMPSYTAILTRDEVAALTAFLESRTRALSAAAATR
jgi:ubiquinol-cytochrome c reductase cytochrome b subunit